MPVNTNADLNNLLASKKIRIKTHQFKRLAARIALYSAMLFTLFGTYLGLFHPDLLFDEGMQLYGPLKNNLYFLLGYLAITETALFFLQFYKKIVLESLIFGCLLILIGFGTIFYSNINQLPFNPVFFVGAIVIGVAHLIYYGIHQYIQRCENDEKIN